MLPPWRRYRRRSVQTRVDEIAERIYRLSTFLPAVGPSGLTFNQFLVDADEPLLFHCGQRALFPAVSRAVASLMDVRRLRWIAFSHVEADECGSLNEWLRIAPQSVPLCGTVAAMVSIDDLADRAPQHAGRRRAHQLRHQGGRPRRACPGESAAPRRSATPCP